jgi:hypothetical protein
MPGFGTGSLALLVLALCAACGASVAPPATGAEPNRPDAVVASPVGGAETEAPVTPDGGGGADDGAVEPLDEQPYADGAVEPLDEQPYADGATADQTTEVHPLLERYRAQVGAWMTGDERARLDRVSPVGTGLAEGAALAASVHERAARRLLPRIFRRVGSKRLRRDARSLRRQSGRPRDAYVEDSSGDILVNYTLTDYESSECYESAPRGRPRSREYSRRCSIAFAAARLLYEPLDERLRWPEFGSFGNCRGEPDYDPAGEMPCFTSGSEGGSLVVLFDLALEIGVPRRTVVAFANATFRQLVREAVGQTRVARIRFTPIGSRRLSTILYDLECWMTAAEWKRFARATGIGASSGLDQRAEDRLLRRFGVRVLSPLWRKLGTGKTRRVARALRLALIDDEKRLPFDAIYTAVDEGELLDDAEYLQCPSKPTRRFERCAAVTDATATFLELTNYWGEDDDGDRTVPSTTFLDLTGVMLDDLLAAGLRRRKLVRELTAVFKKELKAE